MLEFFQAQPLLALFLVCGLGYLVGKIRIGGFSLGVAAVLFVGLGFGALLPGAKLPEIVYQLGLVLFVYTLALSSGPGFVRALGKGGLRDNALVLGMLMGAGALTYLLARAFGLSAPLAAGIFAGSLTNTPALAGVLEALKGLPGEELPTVAYSVAYPLGVIGMLLAIFWLERLWKVNYPLEAKSAGLSDEGLTHRDVRLERELQIVPFLRENRLKVVPARAYQRGVLALVGPETRLERGDVLSVVGAPAEVERAVAALGEALPDTLEQDRTLLDFRRMTVSSRAAMGHTLKDLELPQRYGVLITRIGRGDTDLLPHKNTVLEPGDRVRVVGPPQKLTEVARFLGDSHQAVSEVNVLSFALGLALGLALGAIVFTLPGGASFKLGLAGGPLVMGLLLGFLHRTGPIVWSLPYSAGLTLRQLGLLLFLVGIGTRAGEAFGQTAFTPLGLQLLLCGAVVTVVTALSTLWIGARVLKIPFGVLIGTVAGLQTQPAVLAFARERAASELPGLGYATVYPLAMLSKIVLAQVLLALMG